MVSSTSSRSSSGNGGGSASARTSTVQSPTSTSPVASSGFRCPRGGCRTVPSMRTTYSDRRSWAPVDHALDDAGVIPQVDERQVLAVLATAVDPSAHATTVAAGVGVHGGRRSGRFCMGVRRVTGSPVEARGDSRIGRASGRRFERPRGSMRSCRRRRACHAAVTLTGGELVVAHDDGLARHPSGRPAFIWAFIDRPSKPRSARDPGTTQLRR